MAKYDEAFWRRVAGHARPICLMGTLSRLVENQEQKVTLSLTDNLAEHDVLESLLEDSKPAYDRDKRYAQLDYLLRSPWRYPPLPWGSRFGRRFEPSLFYGALSKSSLFAEAAYYRFVFLEGMQKPFSERLISQVTVFDAMYKTDMGIDLSTTPFVKHESVLRHKSNYAPCQALGTVLRDREIEAIVYLSARTTDRAMNIALFSPAALRSRKHRNPRHGLCETRTDLVTIRLGNELYEFPRKNFLEGGQIPLPA